MEKNKEIPRPTDAELEILKVLWRRGPATVREVNEELSRRRDVGYTTTLKIMQIMSDKELVKRNTEGRTHIYSAAITEKEIQKKLLDRLLDTAFGGSASNLVVQLLGNRRSSPDELRQIKDIIRELENNK